MLADAADVLGGQLKTHVRRLSRLLRPHLRSLDRQYGARLRSLGFDRRQRNALAGITLGAAARLLAQGRRIQVFLEQVEYNGRRLAKLNLPPSVLVAALQEYDRLLVPVLAELPPGESSNLGWVREQLQFCVILTLNKAYYYVRETEAQAFYELFRTELESRNLDELLDGSLSVLSKFCRAREARLFLLDESGSVWRLRAASRRVGRAVSARRRAVLAVRDDSGRRRQLRRPRCAPLDGRSRQLALDPGWQGRFASAWSVPLLSGGQVAGVMQFAFTKPYEWLPREQELLEAAAERCMAAAEKARLVEDLEAREEQVRRLAEHMLHVEEVERRRISRELHDEAGQSLLYIRLQLEMLEKELPRNGAGWRDRIGGVRQVTEHVITETRRLIAALSPAVLDQLGLAAALRQLVARFRKTYPCRVHLHLTPFDRVPRRIETVVYRLVQECCHNIAKHSRALHVNISLSSSDGVLRLDVEDDGIGFLVSEALARSDSFGLAGMRERVTLLGGNFEIDSRPANKAEGRKAGTRIIAELPLARSV